MDGISLQGATVNSNDLIHGMKLNGTLGELFISSHGVALDPETAIVNKVLLKDTDLSLCLNDTAAADTAASDTTYWKIILQDIDLQNVSLRWICLWTACHWRLRWIMPYCATG